MENSLLETNIIESTDLTPIEIALEIDKQGRTTARKLYEFLELSKGQFSRWAKTNILENQFAEENTDFEGFDMYVEGNLIKDYYLTASFAKKLAMGTHNARGEQAKNYFIKVEGMLRHKKIDEAELSPSLRMFKEIFDSVARQEIQQKQLQQAVAETQEELEGVRNVIQIRPTEHWRDNTNVLIKKICYKLKDYKTPRTEIYKALMERAGCDLDIRLNNMRARVLLNGGSRAKCDNLNYLDVIASDKKLIEIYTTIVKEMAIKYKIV